MNFNRTKIYVINMEQSLERKHAMRAACEKIGLQFEFFKAITPNDFERLGFKYEPQAGLEKVGRKLTEGELGCALSHLTLWAQLAKDDTADHYLILEDDVTFNADFKTIIEALPLPQEPHLIRLFGIRKRNMRQIKIFYQEFSLFKMAEGPLLASGYILNKAATKPLLAFCETLFFPIDNMMDMSAHHGVANYCVQPYPLSAQFEDENSTIGVRKKKYELQNDWRTRLNVRVWRIYFSLMKRKELIKLLLKPKPKLIDP